MQPGRRIGAELGVTRQAVVGTIYALNHEFSEGVDRGQLTAADAVLRAVIAMDSDLRDTAALIRPPRQTSL